MPTIAVVDDRTTQRRQLVNGITTSDALPESWEAVGFDPLPEIQNYPDWINEYDIAALVLDERLREEQDDVEVHVDYDGHNVVDLIRGSLPTFPIFIVTAVPNDPSVRERFANVEDIIDRKRFVADSEQLVPRIVRSGQRFYESNEEKLGRMEELSELTAQDKASENELKELSALRAHFQRPYEDQVQTPDAWVTDFENSVRELKELEARINAYVEHKKLDSNS